MIAAWRPTAVFLAVCALASVTLRAESPKPDSRPVAEPISFEENRGQTDPRVKFVSAAPTTGCFWRLMKPSSSITQELAGLFTCA